MDKDLINYLSTIFNEDTSEGVDKMKSALCSNIFKNFLEFENHFRKQSQNSRCYACWNFPTFGIVHQKGEAQLKYSEPICLDCYINSQDYLNYENDEIIESTKNVQIKSFPFGRCICGNPSFHCSVHSKKKQKTDFMGLEETLKSVVIATFRKFDSVLKKKNFSIFSFVNNNKDIIEFILNLTNINDDFLEVISNAISSLTVEMKQILLDTKYFSLDVIISLCDLFNHLCICPEFYYEYHKVLLDTANDFVSTLFQSVSKKQIGESNKSFTDMILMQQHTYSCEFSIKLLEEKEYSNFEYGINFISHFQSQMLKSNFFDIAEYPIFYRSIFKIFQYQIAHIFQKGDEDEIQWIQSFFDGICEVMNEQESNFDTKFMEFTEEDRFNKLIYLYEWTYDIAKLFFSKDEGQYNVNIYYNGLADIIFCALDFNFISDDLFDECQYEEEKKEEEIEEEGSSNALKKSIRSEKVKVSLFDQLIHFFSFYLAKLNSPVIELKETFGSDLFLYGSIIPARLLCWNFSYKMNLGSTLNGGGDNFFKEFNNDEKRRKLLYIGNFGFVQISSLLLDDEDRERLINMIASSFGIFEQSTINNNLDEYLPTLKLCFIFFVGCLYFDRYTSLRVKISDDIDGKDAFRMIRMIHRLKNEHVYLDALNRKEYDIINKVATKRNTTNDKTTFVLKKKDEIPIYWNPFYVINPINEVISLVAKEIPSKGLLLLPSVENELKGIKNDFNDPKIEGLEFHKILMTPTVYCLIYSILSDYFIEKQKNIESIHLSLNLLLIIISHLPVIQECQISNEVFLANGLNELTLLFTDNFEKIVCKKIDFNKRGENSLFDLLVKLDTIGEIVINEIKKKIPSFSSLARESEVKSKKASDVKRAKDLKRTISANFQNQIESFKSSSVKFDLLEEDEDEDLHDVCQICQTVKEEEGLSYMIYIYISTIPSIFDLPSDKNRTVTYCFSMCNHLFHRNCVFKETGEPESDEFTCPIDRYLKNSFMPKVSGFDELDTGTSVEVMVFLTSLGIPLAKLITSFANIFVLNELRFRLHEIQDEIKYTLQALLGRNLFFILWHTIHEYGKKVNKYNMNLFQLFIRIMLISDFRDDRKKLNCVVGYYSSRLKGEEKCLFLRKCRIFEFFVFDKESINGGKLSQDEMTYEKLCQHFSIEIESGQIPQFNFTCSYFQRFLPFSYINMKQVYSCIEDGRKMFALDLINGNFASDVWGVNLQILLDGILGNLDDLPNLFGPDQGQNDDDEDRNEFFDDVDKMDLMIIESRLQNKPLEIDQNAPKPVPFSRKNTRSVNSNYASFPQMLMIVGKENSRVIITYHKKFVEIKPFYVDAEGEPDIGFKRERLLFFNEKNFERFLDVYLSGEFAHKLQTIYV